MIRAHNRAWLIGFAAALLSFITACGAAGNASENEVLLTIVFSADSLGEYEPCG